MFELPKASKDKLSKVHPDLQKVINRAVEIVNELGTDDQFIVTEGLRTKERQLELYNKGLSRKKNTGRHLDGHAVDLAIWHDRDLDRIVDMGELDWKFPVYQRMHTIVLQAAKDVDIPIEWGGDWVSLRDGPHYQLPYKLYPGL